MTCATCGGSGRITEDGPVIWFPWREYDWTCYRCNGTGIQPEPEVVRQPAYSYRMSADDRVTIEPPNSTG